MLGILLCAFSLRSAVASLSPLIDHVAADYPLPPTVIGMIGTAPAVCFALFGLLTPLFARRLGLERVIVVALTAISVGLLLRAVSIDATTLLLATALIFAGVGMGNILLPPLVKTYFPDRLGVMMTVYTTAMAVSTFVPPLIAVPVADAAGWRGSLGMWAIFAVAGLVPWVVMIMRAGRTTAVPTPAAVAPAGGTVFARLARLPLAWSIAAVFGASSTVAYVVFAWLPTILIDRVGVTPAVAGLLLSLFALVGLPASLLVPVLVVRFQATRALSLVSAVCGVLGIAGLLLVPRPEWVWLWTALLGMVCTMFPLALVLISIRARTPESATGLSSFVQSIGYFLSAAFPILTGVLHDATGDWVVPLLVLGAVILASIPFGIVAGRRRTVEEEWERRHGRW